MSWVPMEESARTARRRYSVGWRPLLLVAALAFAFAGVPGAATAGPPSSMTSIGAELFCESEAGFLGIHVHEDEYGSFLEIHYESFEDPPLFGVSEEFTFDGASLFAEVEMIEEGFGPVGNAVVDATLEPLGEPEVYADRFRDGNRWIEIRDTFQGVAPAGSAVLEGFFDFDLSECGGMTMESEFWSTNPNAFVGRFEGRYLECGLEGPDGVGHVFADSSEWGEFMEVFIVPTEGWELFGFTEDVTFTDTELSGVVDLFEGEGEPIEGNGGPVAQAVVQATLESAGFSTTELIHQDARIKMVSEMLDVTGTVAVNGSEFEMVDCHAEAWSDRVWFMNPNGPKAIGHVPDNDTPDGAESLDARATTNAQNKAAAPAPEVTCMLIEDWGDGPMEYPLPIGKTLWYSFEGTGEPVTVDSAGSNFDTIMGVYDAGFDQLACADDVGDESGWSLQAAATIDTVEGATYFVQIGGFGFWDDTEYPSTAGFGRIRLRTR